MGDEVATLALEGLEEVEVAPTQERVWARLITLNPVRPTIDLAGDQFVLGRQSSCNIQFKDMNISGRHCRIFREPCKNGSAIVFLEDLSTNGTYIDGEKVGKGNKLLLSNGSQIALVLNKKKPQDTIAYIYQECCEDKMFEEGGPQKIYDIRETLGAGNFAVVKLAINKATGDRYAVKIIDKKKCFAHSGSRKDALMGEVEILRKLSHPNIINIKDVFDTEKTLYLVLELVECGELFGDIVKDGKYSEEKARAVFKQIIEAVLYLHNQGIAHRDLKPENILLKTTEPLVLKLSDFGLSRTIGDGSFMKTMCGTPQYLAPEIITSGGVDGYGKEVDMWSVGAILYVLLCGYCPFEEGKAVSIFDQIKKGLVDFPDKDWAEISLGAKDLIKKLLTVTPSARYTAQQCMNHPWIRGEDLSADVPKTPEQPPTPELPADNEMDISKSNTATMSPTNSMLSKSSDKITKRKRESSDTEDDNPITPDSKVPKNGSKVQQQHSSEDVKLLNKSSSGSKMQISDDETKKELKKSVDKIPKSGSNLSKKSSAIAMATSSDDSDDDSNKYKTKTPSKQTKKQLPECKYGKGCYRKNPQHFLEFSHPK